VPLLNFLDPLCITLVANLYFSQIKNLGCHTDNPEIPCEKPLQMGIHKKPSDYKLPESKIKMIYHHETASTTWHLMDKGGLPKATLQTMSPYRSNAVVSNLQQEETFYPLEW